jgi:hypothetical protein
MEGKLKYRGPRSAKTTVWYQTPHIVIPLVVVTQCLMRLPTTYRIVRCSLSNSSPRPSHHWELLRTMHLHCQAHMETSRWFDRRLHHPPRGRSKHIAVPRAPRRLSGNCTCTRVWIRTPLRDCEGTTRPLRPLVTLSTSHPRQCQFQQPRSVANCPPLDNRPLYIPRPSIRFRSHFHQTRGVLHICPSRVRLLRRFRTMSHRATCQRCHSKRPGTCRPLTR